MSGEASGSYFRAVRSCGASADGRHLPNGDSTTGDQTFTLPRRGTDLEGIFAAG